MQKLYTLFRKLGFDESAVDVPKTSADQSQLDSIFNFTFQIIAAISVLVIVIAGLTYVISQGDPQRVNRAKDAILYAIIGLVVAILGRVIVGFVIAETSV